VLTYNAYNETLQQQQEKELEIQRLREKYEQNMKAMYEKMQMLTVHKGKLEILEEKMDKLDRRPGLF
jgi:hypothetical protein